mgnify:CR=1 FL=1
MKAYVFPGQGAQFSGMGKDLYDNSELARSMFAKANDILGFDIQKVQLNEIRHSALLPIGFAVACAQASHVASNARA